MPVGPERNCRAKPSGIALLTRRATAPSARIPGVRSHPHRATEISICGVGIQFLSGHFPRVPTIFFLSWLLRELFRCTTFRDERRLAAHGRVHAAAVVSQLVPAALSVHLCSVPLRRTLTFEKSSGVRALLGARGNGRR